MKVWTAIRMTIVLTLLVGIAYPLAIAGLAHVFFPFQADGSLLERNRQVVGSQLIGQNFVSLSYFHPRPSAAGDKGYDATASGGSNLGPTNKVLINTVKQHLKAVLENNPGATPSDVPVDLVTSSGSGLDPDISPAAAELQVARVAKARGLDEQTVRRLVLAHTRRRWAGFLGEPRVNVLELNLALDGLTGAEHNAIARSNVGKP
jgi:potassium-transporting ATPase KdpC subunit